MTVSDIQRSRGQCWRMASLEDTNMEGYSKDDSLHLIYLSVRWCFRPNVKRMVTGARRCCCFGVPPVGVTIWGVFCVAYR
jgi:hypothetical protein